MDGSTGIVPSRLQAMDGIAAEAIQAGATPGAVVLVAHKGKIVYEKSYGYFDYAKLRPMPTNAIFDMASVTKICATTISIMKLYDEGKIKLTDTLGKFIAWTRGSNKGGLTIKNILLHQAGLKSWIPFYKETIDTIGNPLGTIYSTVSNKTYGIEVAKNMYMRNSWRDTMYKRIIQSPLETNAKYVYSDNDFIFLGLIVEKISGMPLENYVQKTFYQPLGLAHTGFNAAKNFPADLVVPTEQEKLFRQQLIQGHVHDPGAAMFGGVAGHAGLFSTAQDLVVIMQLLLNGGTFGDKQYLKKETIDLFTSYNSDISRRGLGFDKPEKDNATRKESYPAKFVSSKTFGHTGFTGTCVWADPENELIYIFLSNRVHPEGGDNTKLLKLNIRSRIHDAVYLATRL